MDRRLFIINELKRLAQEIAPRPIRKNEFVMLSGIPNSQLRKHFKSWDDALDEAGIEVTAPEPKRLSDDELMNAIRELWIEFGRRPTWDSMNNLGKYSVRPYNARWGTFTKAVDHYVQHFGIPTPSPDIPSSEHATPIPESPRRRTSILSSTSPQRPRALGTRTRSPVLGELIDFRGLRHAPVNEQGVVYLFGMVSRELGFLVESVRTAYPDCEGKRRLDDEGNRWVHVRIEFEYKSTNFKEHGHDPEQCDLIVCWIHDWRDSPLEVLELRDAVRHLPRG